MSLTLLFDIDGTLTRPQQSISYEMTERLVTLNKKYSVYLVTGSDLELAKNNGQINSKIEYQLSGIFACQGSELWQQGNRTIISEAMFPQSMRVEMNKLVDTSEYPFKTGKHINDRIGMINFSVVGRNCDLIQRGSYYEWDKKHGERKRIVEHLAHMFTDYTFNIGGEISIDIAPKGMDKSQVVKYLRMNGNTDPLYFFGDKTQKGGNDYSIANALEAERKDNRVFTVKSPEDTLNHLSKM